MVDAQGSFFKDRRSSSEVGYLATCLRRGDSIFLVKFMVVCFCKQSHFCKMQVCDNLCFTMSSLTDELLKIQKKKGQKRVKLLITVTPRILRFVKNTKIHLFIVDPSKSGYYYGYNCSFLYFVQYNHIIIQQKANPCH